MMNLEEEGKEVTSRRRVPIIGLVTKRGHECDRTPTPSLEVMLEASMAEDCRISSQSREDK